jgi:hypothetical protein
MKGKKTTVKTGCEFSFHAVEDEEGGWTLKHRGEAKFNRHNHGLRRFQQFTTNIENSMAKL